MAAFLARIAELGAGMPGWAFTTAALTSVDGARNAVASLDQPVAVLLDEGGPSMMIDLNLGKAEAGLPAGLPPKVPSRKILVGALALLVVGVLVLVVVLVRRLPSSAPPPPAPPSNSAPAPHSVTAPPSTSRSTTPTVGGGPGPSG
ncbi:hypothetical protein [Geodermatophilus saharensis]|uniref:hypothetical protein n=1 Tax=Geodermatophilus saharensis TaxID=1137994 RepID=UPI00114008D4|nr:hypothetical protein [Geodermatophilus saharensis]